uniref:Zona pellucida sperm-binding protein 3-like n=1 Tax=Callorhinchus milii TaxID=7868 RepID=A0A4W3HIG0_CALMI|eukprot:gi/632968329/ref/XP_007900466.1/ PREDICTED: zona pellucida sperm-binding protein 3-like [Callorhinchus milii]
MLSLGILALLLAIAASAVLQAWQNATSYTCGNNTLTVSVWLRVLGEEMDEDPTSAFTLGGCSPSAFNPNTATIVFHYSLLDCEATRLVSNKEVVYSNKLRYQPQRDQVQPFTRDIQCHYPREMMALPWFSLPMTGSLDGEGSLIFSMKVMADNWDTERQDNVFFLGTLIHLEAAVITSFHQSLRLYVEECTATPAQDPTSSTENYTIITNHGCLIDGKTARSMFLPRINGSRLRFVVEAFTFTNLGEAEVYVHCTVLVWDPSHQPNSTHKACSFDRLTGRWQLLDAPSQSSLCDCCETTCQPAGHRLKRAKEPHELAGLHHVMTVGPLQVHNFRSGSSSSKVEGTVPQRMLTLMACPPLGCLFGILFLSIYKWKSTRTAHP